ncbi:MAG: pirin family protein, partial [Nocardioides sp.]
MTTGPMTITVVSPREVPLGGLRDMRVRRTLPARGRTMIGAWCFIDHYGPSAVDEMVVAPHPHTGLQTASWLFSGAITHRDSAGNHAPVRPGELNLMTAGRGISHSEVSVPGEVLHGVQLWIALPAATRNTAPGFAHYAPPEIAGAGWRGRVFLGETLGVSSPVATHTRLVGAEITLDADAVLGLDETAGFEYG